MRENTVILVRIALAGLFSIALVSKLRAPSGLLEPLRVGLGLPDGAAAAVFVLAVLALSACIGALLLRRGPLGLFLSGAFFLTGAAYAVVLARAGWTGSCGCGVAPIAELANPLTTRAYQNTACAVLCVTLGFRALPGKGTDDETEEAAPD